MSSKAFNLTEVHIKDFSKSHLSIIKEAIELNPAASLTTIAEDLNQLTALATCPIRITPKVLEQLGHYRADPSPPPPTDNNDNGHDEQRGALTSMVIRRQLEERHNKIQVRIEDLLENETITEKKIKVFQMLSGIDDKLVERLLDLMNEDAAPMLPMAILILCLRQLGVAEDDIMFVQDI